MASKVSKLLSGLSVVQSHCYQSIYYSYQNFFVKMLILLKRLHLRYHSGCFTGATQSGPLNFQKDAKQKDAKTKTKSKKMPKKQKDARHTVQNSALFSPKRKRCQA
jgi:hypothetical protein